MSLGGERERARERDRERERERKATGYEPLDAKPYTQPEEQILAWHRTQARKVPGVEVVLLSGSRWCF
jgi:hypothetical protein